MVKIILTIYLVFGALFGVYLILSGEIAKQPRDDQDDVSPLSIPELFFLAVLLWPIIVMWYLFHRK